MSTLKPKVTVYIASHNYDKYLSSAIDSVLRQTFKNWELLLIDDGSIDDTRKIFDKYRNNKQIKIYQTDNIGLPAVANFVVRKAKGDYIIRLDADDIFDEYILLILSHYLDNNPKVALVFPDYYLIDDCNGLIMQEIRNPIFNNKNLLDIAANGACTMIRKNILNEIGGYREDLRAQDGFDIWTKIIKKNKCSNINLPLFYYRRHNDNITNNTERILRARQTIKRDSVFKEIKKNRPIISIIPCRKNYDMELNLWSKKIDGVTLLDFLIRKSTASPLFDKIVITSDTPKVIDIIKQYDDKRLIFVKREKRHTAPSANIALTLKQIARVVDPEYKGISVLSYIQAPMVTTKNLEEAVHTLILNKADSAIAVEEITTPLFKRSPNGLSSINHQNKFRNDFEVIYSDARTSLAIKNNNIKEDNLTITGKKVVHFVVPKKETFFISSKHDLNIAEHLNKSQDK